MTKIINFKPGVNSKYQAVLLIGPTGAGKTPLGNLLEKQGIKDRQCFHFDFGRNLRKAASGIFPNNLISSHDIAFINKVLASGALLENETFYLAKRILSAYIHETGISTDDLIIMNGLPRHFDQAKDTSAMVSIAWVIVLNCTPEVVFERIRLNSGGDRAHRKDDSLDKIKDKLKIYTGRTLPLLNFFSDQNIPVTSIPIDVHTSPDDVITQLY